MNIENLKVYWKEVVKIVLKNGYRFEGRVTDVDDYSKVMTIDDVKDGSCDVDVPSIAVISIIKDDK